MANEPLHMPDYVGRCLACGRCGVSGFCGVVCGLGERHDWCRDVVLDPRRDLVHLAADGTYSGTSYITDLPETQSETTRFTVQMNPQQLFVCEYARGPGPADRGDGHGHGHRSVAASLDGPLLGQTDSPRLRPPPRCLLQTGIGRVFARPVLDAGH